MGLISVEFGSNVNWDQKSGLFVGDNEANSKLTLPFCEKWIDKNVIDWMNKYQQFDLK